MLQLHQSLHRAATFPLINGYCGADAPPPLGQMSKVRQWSSRSPSNQTKCTRASGKRHAAKCNKGSNISRRSWDIHQFSSVCQRRRADLCTDSKCWQLSSYSELVACVSTPVPEPPRVTDCLPQAMKDAAAGIISLPQLSITAAFTHLQYPLQQWPPSTPLAACLWPAAAPPRQLQLASHALHSVLSAPPPGALLW